MSTSLRSTLTVMMIVLTVTGLIWGIRDLVGLGAGMGIVLLAIVVEHFARRMRA